MTCSDSDQRTLAEQYVEHGLHLVPIPLGLKGPRATDWNLPDKVVTDPKVAALLTGNIGIAHALCRPFPTVALDIDDLDKGTVWLGNRGVSLPALLNAPDAVQITSGRPGRAKILYRLQKGQAPIQTLQIKDPATHEMILEFRCATANGLSVQDVLPPSIHPDTGRPYEWAGKGSWRNIPSMPELLILIWRAEIAKRSLGRPARAEGHVVSTAVEDTPRQRAMVLRMLEHVSADCSYDIYRNIVWAILSLGWRDGEELARRWCASASHRFSSSPPG